MARKKETQIETDINNGETKPKTKRGSKASAKAAGRKRGRPKKITDEAIMKDADVYLQECQQRFLKADNVCMDIIIFTKLILNYSCVLLSPLLKSFITIMSLKRKLIEIKFNFIFLIAIRYLHLEYISLSN